MWTGLPKRKEAQCWKGMNAQKIFSCASILSQQYPQVTSQNNLCSPIDTRGLLSKLLSAAVRLAQERCYCKSTRKIRHCTLTDTAPAKGCSPVKLGKKKKKRKGLANHLNQLLLLQKSPGMWRFFFLSLKAQLWFRAPRGSIACLF